MRIVITFLSIFIALWGESREIPGLTIDSKQGVSWYTCRSDGMNMSPTIWRFAKSYCENLYFMGSSNWRLPTPKELSSAAKEGLFADAPVDVYWTSKPDPDAPEDNAIVVYSTNGYISSQDICDFARIICVE